MRASKDEIFHFNDEQSSFLLSAGQGVSCYFQRLLLTEDADAILPALIVDGRSKGGI